MPSRKSPASASRGANAIECNAVERAPFRLDCGKQRSRSPRRWQRRNDTRTCEIRRELDDAILEVIVDVRERERGALTLTGARDAVGDGPVRQDTGDEDLAVGQKTHANPEAVNGGNGYKDTRNAWRSVIALE
jgi:hypothetical protein